MENEGSVASAEVGGWTVESNISSSEEIVEALTPDKEPGDGKPEEKSEEERRSEAAAELGRAGGKAAAEKRAEAKEAEKQSAEKAEKAEPKEGAEKSKEAEPSDDKPDEKADEDKEKDPSRDPNRRVRQAVAEKNQAVQALKEASERYSLLEARLNAFEQGEKPAEKPEERLDRPPRPRADQFDDPEKYLHALLKWDKEESRAELRAEILTELRQAIEEERRREGVVDEQNRALAEQIAEFRTATKQHLKSYSEEVLSLTPEFQLAEGETPTAESWIANELVFSPETAPALMLYFTEHKDELQRIAALSNPRAVSREMAKLEARLESATTGTRAKPEQEVSKAAPPVTPVAGAPYVSEGTEPDTAMGFDKYHSLRQKQIRAGSK
jgi:hypothetical protein